MGETIEINKNKLYNALLAFRSIDVSGLRNEVRVYMETSGKELDGSVKVVDIRFIQQLLKKLEGD